MREHVSAGFRGRWRAWWLAAVLAGPGGAARADCIIDLYANPVPPFTTFDTLFPNWVAAPAAAFTLYECDDAICTGCTTSTIVGLTILNYGTATGGAAGDVTGMSFGVICGSKTVVGPLAMTYAGVWAGRAAWTWVGSIAWGGNPCNGPGFSCSCAVDVQVFADIGPCPVAGRTLNLGPGFNDVLNPGWPGGMYDSCACAGPWSQLMFGIKTIDYVNKVADRDTAAPGDTINYKVYYGRPGAAALTSITITDTQPPTTHYLPGSGTTPDPGWDPDPGPPVRLRWTDLTVSPVTGGPTEEIAFSLTVDWGNGESFEPGSGDVAAPEGTFLANRAQMAWAPAPSCASGRNSPVTLTSVRRFLFWKLGDNDVLYSASLGQPPDEMTYSIFVKNVSTTKTWWDVSIWDTVPAELDSWGAGFGFEDPCAGWTMTPTGCAAASPGRLVAGATTLLTWRLDMPPGMTLNVRWKASVKAATVPGVTAVNRASVLELGRAGVIDGTGHSGSVKTFTQEAPIVLPTMYTSYIGIAATSNNFMACCHAPAPLPVGQLYWISVYPLNKKTDFTLYKQEHPADAWALNGGASPSIALYAGGCLTGGGDWISGCKVERAPAFYKPVAFDGGASCPQPVDVHNIYKLVANSPVIWELETGAAGANMDNMTYTGMTNLTYRGFVSYTFIRVCTPPQTQDGLYVVNTSETTPTTVHIFRWDAPALSYQYQTTMELNIESQAYFGPPVEESHMIISGDAPIIVLKGYPGMGAGGSYNDLGTMAPNKTNGYLVSPVGSGDFYAYAGGPPNDNANLVVGNMGVANAVYEVWEYFSDTPTLLNPSTTHLSSFLLGSSGTWVKLATDTAPAGIANPANPYVYGAGDDALVQDFSLYKIKVLSGGPVQVFNGHDVMAEYGSGSVMHARTPPVGNEYWFHMTETSGCGSPSFAVTTLDYYCPKSGTAVTAVSGDGYAATYTTPGPDSCVSFKALTPPAAPARRNWKVTSVGGIIAAAHQIRCQLAEKLYTAPFVSQGVRYSIIAPPIVFSGQSFWITVVVLEVGGTTKPDYCGTTSFTSTDTNAKIEGAGMETYNFTWSSTSACNVAPNENGVKVFVNVSLTQLGLQTIVATDTTDGSIVGLTTLMVVGADVKLEKRPTLAVQASGDTVAFRVCWSNYSSASAFTFVITDAVPRGTTFVPEAGTGAFDCGNTDGVVPVTAYSTTASATPPPAFTTGNPTGGTFWLRWTIPVVGVNTTGCVCYRVSVN